MGVDLTLMPLIGEDYWAAHSMLLLERRRELWPEFEKLDCIRIPKPLMCYVARNADGDTGYGALENSPYGERLTYITAGQIKKFENLDPVQDNWLNRAIWEYIMKMPDDWKVVLYWH